MTTEVKTLKSIYFKNTSDKGGAMARAITEHTPNSILNHSQTKKHGRMWGYSKPDTFLTNLEKNNGLYEIIHHFPHKVYFDIDEKAIDNFEGFLENVKRVIGGYFPNADLAISGSHTPEKASLHLVINNYLINNEADRTHMKALTKYIQDNELPPCDWKVYTKNRNMKCINQSKLDGRVQTIIENPDYKKHIITAFFNDSNLPLPQLSEPIMEQIAIAKSRGTFDLGLLPKLVLTCPDEINYDEITPEQCLSLLPINKSFSHDYIHIVARFCKYNALSFENFCSWYSKKNSSQDAFQKWRIHFDNLHKFPPVTLNRMKTIMATFYPHIKKDIHYRRFTQTFLLPDENIKMIETIDQTTFNTDKKYIIHNIGMGGGKTAQTISYLQTQYEYIWIAPNRALAQNTKKRFEDEDIEITHYEQLTTKQKKEGEMNDCNRLIVCLNSLHYLTEKNFDVLVIDEIETLIDKFEGDFMCGKDKNIELKKNIWKTFIKLFRNAKKVILLDAFITTKTLNLIKSIEGNLDDSVIFKRIHEPQTRTIHYQDGFEMTIHNAIQKIKNGSKVFIFYPYKNANKYGSMEQVYHMIKDETGKKGIFYNADVSDKVKNELKNVNESWNGRDFVITNNILTCGVNYEGLDFDYKFLFIAPHNVPRDIIQVSYRARYLSTGLIFVCYLGKMNSNDTWLDDCKEFKCPIYTNLYNNILIEKKAPIKRAFQLFCLKAHYKQVTNKNIICDKIQGEIQNLISKYDTGFSFASIEAITFGYAEHIQQACFAQEATMYEKMMLRKFFYMKDFTEKGQLVKFIDEMKDLTEEFIDEMNIIEHCWDENYFFFFKQIHSLLLNDNNIFNKIAKYNNEEGMLYFAKDLKKIKLNDELLDQIFTEFKFKSLSKTSSVLQILRSIYNAYFGKQIIEVKYPPKEAEGKTKKNHHISYNMNNQYDFFYKFCCKHLILDHTTKAVKNGHLMDTSSPEIENDEPFEF
jgi:hypothetical protein